MPEENTVNLLWVAVSAVLVFLMQGGFLCLETGLTRSKNNINVAIKNLADFGISTLLFWLVGFGLMYGSSLRGFIGIDSYGIDFGADFNLAIFFIFQVMFCGTAVTILSGGVAERLKFSGYIIITTIVSTMVYPIFGHWVWGGSYMGEAQGLLGARGFVDFAGSSVVHSVGGWVALATLLVIGARTDRFNADGSPNKIPSSSLPLAALGTLILYVGWLGFNGGSHLVFGQETSRTLFNTLLAGSFSMVAVMIASYFLFGHVKVELLLNGILAGLVSITAVPHAVTVGQTAIIAIGGGLLMVTADHLLERFKIDDAVGAIPVHLAAGIWGTLAVGFFGDLDVLGTGLTRPQQIGIQLVGIVLCAFWAGLIPYILLKQIDQFTPLRVSPEEERVGLNVSEHGARSELLDMFIVMDEQFRTGDLSLRVPIEPFTVIGQIAEKYNLIMERLEELTKKSTSIIQSATDGIIVFQEEGFELIEMNPAAARLFGFEPSAAVKVPFTALFGYSKEENTESIKSFMPFDLIDRKGYEEVRGYRPDGTSFPAELALTKITVGSTNFFTGIFRDITRRKELMIAKESAIEAALEANEAKSNFLANMSHEIRTPLNAVIGLTTLLLESPINDEQRDFLQTINNSGESLLVIINEILDFSKIEAGKLDLESHPFNVRECIEDTLDLMAAKAKERDLELAYFAAPLKSDMFIGDVTRLRQILINLIGNAVKFTLEGEVIVYLTYQELDDNFVELQFEVRDTGIGIPEDRVDRLFEAFSQADSSTTRKFGGTGLGLTISRMLSEKMGGRMWVASEVKKGSSFYFTIQLKQLPRPIENQHYRTTMFGRRILVVDDNATNRLILERVLTEWGFEVILAEGAFEALKILGSQQKIDLAIYDFLMPEMDGLHLAESTKSLQNRKDLSMVLLTSAGELVGERVKEFFYANMSKPIRHSNLFNILVSFFDGQIEPDEIIEPKQLERDARAPLKILLVDDNKINQKVGLRMLNRVGYEADTANDGVEAVEAVKNGNYDLVFMDVQMPNMSGPEATSVIRTKLDLEKQPWIVALTANAMKGDREGYLANGMDAYLSKPLRINHLEEVIDELIEINRKMDSVGGPR